MPSSQTLQQAAKLAIEQDRAIMLDYYQQSASGTAFLGEDPDTKERILVKSKEESTSLIKKIFKAGPGGSCGGPGRVLRRDRAGPAEGPPRDGRRTGEGPAEGPGEDLHGDRGPQGVREGPHGVRDGPSHEGSNAKFTL